MNKIYRQPLSTTIRISVMTYFMVASLIANTSHFPSQALFKMKPTLVKFK